MFIRYDGEIIHQNKSKKKGKNKKKIVDSWIISACEAQKETYIR